MTLLKICVARGQKRGLSFTVFFSYLFLKVGEYLHFVNGQDVLDKSHTDVARIILMGASTASLVSFVEKDRLS